MDTIKKSQYIYDLLFELGIWAVAVYFLVYVGIAGMDQFEQDIYNFVQFFVS